MLYETTKALHIISIISWMAGLLYLPRLFVYHVPATRGSELCETLKTMERRLLRYILTPAMVASWITGLILLSIVVDFHGRPPLWVELKILLVLGLSAVHGVLARYVRLFARGENTRGATFYRVLNEVPTIVMIAIVFLVIFKP